MTKIIKTYKYRLKLSKVQQIRIDEWINTCRAIHNLALETKKYAYNSRKINLSKFDLVKQLTPCRKEFDWIKDVPIGCLQESVERMYKSYDSFFKGGGFPKYARRDKYSSITFKITTKTGVSEYKLPKIGIVKTLKDRTVKGKVRKSIITRKNGKYYISILTKQDREPLSTPNDSQVGLDMGISFFASLSIGKQIENPRHTLKYEKQLRVESRSLARKVKGSNSRRKQRLVVSKLHEKIFNIRQDFLHKESTKLINEFSLIAVEDLKVSNMILNKRLSKHISDASWSEFFRQLEYKSDWYGNTFIKVNPRYTSQTCNDCGEVDKKSRVSQSKFVCTSCGVESNADINASKEILKRGLVEAENRKRKAIA